MAILPIRRYYPLIVADLGRDYINRYAKRHKKTWSEDQRRLDSYVLPAFGFKPITEVVRADVTKLVDGIGKDEGKTG
jgi:hypothetical protein